MTMRVLVAGASGAIGRPLVERLLQGRHEVVGLCTTAESESRIRALGANAVRCDVLDAERVRTVVEQQRPDAIIAQLTRLPKEFDPRKITRAYEANNRVRLEGTRNLMHAAERAGVERFVCQSSAFWYRPTPGDLKTEADPFWTDAPEPIGEAVRVMERTEALVRRSGIKRRVLLRYATFYGPGTWFAPGGTVGRLVRRRQYPIVGTGDAVSSFLHVEDAAAATVAALERGAEGTFNVADDEPAAAREWVPALAQALGAPPPRRVPAWVARLVIGRALVEYTTNLRGASNARAKEQLSWTPRWPSWRQGFREGLGEPPAAVARQR